MIAEVLKKLQAKHTPEFDFTPPLPPEGATASERFENFHEKNPHIFENLRNLAEYHAKRGERISVKLLFEEMRNIYRMGTNGDGEYAINNNYTSFYARMLIDRCPHLAGRIEIRKQRVA